jgi:PAS domain S-box-containing protein
MLSEIEKREEQTKERLRYSIKRVDEALDAIQKAAVGDLNVFVPVSEKKDEFDALAAGLNMMFEEMRERAGELETKVKDLDKARAILYSLSEDIQKEKESVEIKVKERTMELEQERGKLTAVTENMTTGAILLDGKGRAIFTNEAAKNIFGLTDEKNILEAFFTKFSEADVKEHFMRCLEGTSYFVPEVEVSSGIFEISFHYLLEKEKDKTPLFHLIWIRDITEEKLLERSKTEFVSIASHQLRTPLTGIKLFLEMLINEEVGKLNNKQRSYMIDVRESAERMVRLTNDLLSVSRLEAGRLKIEPKPTYLEELIKSTIKEAESLDKVGKCSISFKKPEKKLPKILIDPILARQVIYNLIANAIQYSPPERCSIIVKLENKDEYYMVSVEDKGIGIPKEAQSRLFNKFFRADNAIKRLTEGSGLGLYVVEKIVNSWGGEMSFKSKENKGSTFSFMIPKRGMKEKKGKEEARGWWS